MRPRPTPLRASTSAQIPDGGGDDSGGHEGSTNPPARPRDDKVDLLFVVQNSASMLGVGDYLQASVQAMFDRLLNPNCVDARGHVVGVSSAGRAPREAEFQPITDIHVGHAHLVARKPRRRPV